MALNRNTVYIRLLSKPCAKQTCVAKCTLRRTSLATFFDCSQHQAILLDSVWEYQNLHHMYVPFSVRPFSIYVCASLRNRQLDGRHREMSCISYKLCLLKVCIPAKIGEQIKVPKRSITSASEALKVSQRPMNHIISAQQRLVSGPLASVY